MPRTQRPAPTERIAAMRLLFYGRTEPQIAACLQELKTLSERFATTQLVANTGDGTHDAHVDLLFVSQADLRSFADNPRMREVYDRHNGAPDPAKADALLDLRFRAPDPEIRRCMRELQEAGCQLQSFCIFGPHEEGGKEVHLLFERDEHAHAFMESASMRQICSRYGGDRGRVRFLAVPPGALQDEGRRPEPRPTLH